MTPYGFHTHLMQAFDFDAADLADNRAGRLSAAQKGRIKKGTRRALWLLVLAPSVVWGATLIVSALTTWSLDAPSGAVMAGVLFLTVTLALTGGLHWRRLNLALDRGVVESVEIERGGIVQEGDTTAPGAVRLDDRQLLLRPQQVQTLKKGTRYRVYYTRPLNRVVAVEPVDGPIRDERL